MGSLIQQLQLAHLLGRHRHHHRLRHHHHLLQAVLTRRAGLGTHQHRSHRSLMVRQDRLMAAQVHHHQFRLVQCKSLRQAIPPGLMVPQSLLRALVEEAEAVAMKVPFVAVPLPRLLMMLRVPKMK